METTINNDRYEQQMYISLLTENPNKEQVGASKLYSR